MGKITVTANVTRAYAPDVVNFNIHICKVDDNNRELVRYNKAVIDELLARISEMRIEEDSIKENSFRIVINREYVDGKYVENGYKLDSSYTLSSYIDYELMDSIRGMLTELGVEFSVSYELEDENAIRDDLLAEAVGKTRLKANVIAEAVGMRVGDMLEVRYGNDMVVRPLMARASGSGDASPKDIEITESVEVEWGLEK